MREPLVAGQATDTDYPRLLFTNPTINHPYLKGVDRMHLILTEVKLFTLLLISICGIFTSAQASLMATLTHGSEIKLFYSANALKEAYAAAQDGDVITLSPGTFNATDFTSKKVTVRGAGMMPDSNPTVIFGATHIDIPQTGENKNFRMIFEDMYFPYTLQYTKLIDFAFIKCNIYDLTYYGRSNIDNGLFIHCVLNDCFIRGKGSFTYVSCIIRKGNYSTGKHSFLNCDIINCNSIGNWYKNCLFVYDFDNSNSLRPATQINCYYIGPCPNFFSYMSYTSNTSLPAGTPVFKESRDSYELLGENAAAWLGTDGTQVGIYGGPLPFGSDITNSKITELDVYKKVAL